MIGCPYNGIGPPPSHSSSLPPSSPASIGGAGAPYAGTGFPMSPELLLEEDVPLDPELLAPLDPLELLLVWPGGVVSPPHAASAVAPAKRIAARERRVPTGAVGTVAGASGSTFAQNGQLVSELRT